MAVAKSNSNKNLQKSILETNETLKLKDRYDLGEQLGWGQFGIIRSCSDKLTGEILACKSISKDKLVTHEDVNSIKLEIEIMTKLSGHSNLVDLKAVYDDEDCVHLVMELCAGGELYHQLEKRGRFSESEACIIFKQLMEVVIYCHNKGVVHRDLKPENVLLATKDSSSPIKLADFGLATYIKPGQRLHGTVGSPFYIAPEVLSGGYNQAADVWSAGVILYILLSGIPPFWGKSKSRIFDAVRAADLRFQPDPWDHISDSAKELIRGMLCKDPSQRLTARQVLDHTWISCPSPLSMASYKKHQNQGCGKINTCASFMARNQDISFNIGSPIICDSPSPTVTCQSSFSSFLVAPQTPCLASDLFSFRSSGGSGTLEFSTPISTMCSFAFFGSSLVAEQGNCELDFSADIQAVDLVSQDSSLLYVEQQDAEREHKITDVKRLEVSGGTRIFSSHSKRNRTIGLGEFDQLDLMVTESIIRWASCTNLPTATSLRSSLVC